MRQNKNSKIQNRNENIYIIIAWNHANAILLILNVCNT